MIFSMFALFLFARGISLGPQQAVDKIASTPAPIEIRAFTPHPSAAVGKPITVGIDVQNVSDHDVWLVRGLLCYNIRVQVSDTHGHRVSHKNENLIICAAIIQSKKSCVLLKSKSTTRFADVTRWLLTLDKPGKYTLRLTYFVVRPELVRALGFALEPAKPVSAKPIEITVG